MIVLKALCKCFGKKIVYENVNLTFEAGSSYALVGVSGSGKTNSDVSVILSRVK